MGACKGKEEEGKVMGQILRAKSASQATGFLRVHLCSCLLFSCSACRTCTPYQKRL